MVVVCFPFFFLTLLLFFFLSFQPREECSSDRRGEKAGIIGAGNKKERKARERRTWGRQQRSGDDTGGSFGVGKKKIKQKNEEVFVIMQ